jgi:glycosyltransferase involved in cell wall biosynthesis
MRFSVLICTHNRASTFHRTLAAMENLLPPQTGSWELIVVDNASTDNTREVVQQFADSNPAPSSAEQQWWGSEAHQRRGSCHPLQVEAARHTNAAFVAETHARLGIWRAGRTSLRTLFSPV